jgi:hypothetical protein
LARANSEPEVENLGRLATTIADQTKRQPKEPENPVPAHAHWLG